MKQLVAENIKTVKQPIQDVLDVCVFDALIYFTVAVDQQVLPAVALFGLVGIFCPGSVAFAG